MQMNDRSFEICGDRNIRSLVHKEYIFSLCGTH